VDTGDLAHLAKTNTIRVGRYFVSKEQVLLADRHSLACKLSLSKSYMRRCHGCGVTALEGDMCQDAGDHSVISLVWHSLVNNDSKWRTQNDKGTPFNGYEFAPIVPFSISFVVVSLCWQMSIETQKRPNRAKTPLFWKCTTQPDRGTFLCSCWRMAHGIFMECPLERSEPKNRIRDPVGDLPLSTTIESVLKTPYVMHHWSRGNRIMVRGVYIIKST
jgi:hypothetical protein